jgi:putative endonuclease
MPRHTATDLRITGEGPLGRLGERLAVAHLAGEDGLDVVATNWSLHRGEVRGELDVVALDRRRGLVVVTEVKARRRDDLGGPLAAVTPRKQAKVRQLATALLVEGGLPFRRVRFDVVGLVLPGGGRGRLTHVEGAF